MRPLGGRLPAVDGDGPFHALPVQKRPEAVPFLFKAAEELRELDCDLGLEEEAETPVAVVILRMHLGDPADRPRTIAADLDGLHHRVPFSPPP